MSSALAQEDPGGIKDYRPCEAELVLRKGNIQRCSYILGGIRVLALTLVQSFRIKTNNVCPAYNGKQYTKFESNYWGINEICILW